MRESSFARMHPVVNVTFLLLVMLITMITMNPIIIGISFAASFLYSLYLEGAVMWKRVLFMMFPIAVFSILILPMFNHNGVTPLFYMNDMPVTLENIVYGCVMTMMLVSVILWFVVWNNVISSEKFLYIFGRLSPSLALVISMVFRMIPMMIQKWHEIHDAQMGMLCIEDDSGVFDRIRQFIKEISILISWCLENSIDTSISMESRGYGTGRRTTYHRFNWHCYDVIFIIVESVGALLVFAGAYRGIFYVSYFPIISVECTSLKFISLAAVTVFIMTLPLIIDMERRLV